MHVVADSSILPFFSVNRTKMNSTSAGLCPSETKTREDGELQTTGNRGMIGLSHARSFASLIDASDEAGLNELNIPVVLRMNILPFSSPTCLDTYKNDL